MITPPVPQRIVMRYEGSVLNNALQAMNPVAIYMRINYVRNCRFRYEMVKTV